MLAVEVNNDLSVESPKPTDPVGIWLGLLIAKPLKASGIVFIADLLTIINSFGPHWYKNIPGIGPTRAKHIMSWLQQTTLLSLNISNDSEATELWIRAKLKKRSTARYYRLQAERFLLWCLFEKGKTLSSVTTEDWSEYGLFMVAVSDASQPWIWRLERSQWVGSPNNIKRWDPEWKPFTGSMTKSSILKAIITLKGFLSYLLQIRYLKGDCWHEITRRRNRRSLI